MHGVRQLGLGQVAGPHPAHLAMPGRRSRVVVPFGDDAVKALACMQIAHGAPRPLLRHRVQQSHLGEQRALVVLEALPREAIAGNRRAEARTPVLQHRDSRRDGLIADRDAASLGLLRDDRLANQLLDREVLEPLPGHGTGDRLWHAGEWVTRLTDVEPLVVGGHRDRLAVNGGSGRGSRKRDGDRGRAGGHRTGEHDDQQEPRHCDGH